MNKIRRAFTDQRKRAAQRGIPFNFEFEDWLRWWEEQLGANWFKKRGCKQGQYVMARKWDEGAYERGNVVCITASDNHALGAIRDYKRGWTYERLDEEVVLLIYKSTDLYSDLRQRFGVSNMTIQNIKCRKTYGRMTDDLGEPGRSIGRGKPSR